MLLALNGRPTSLQNASFFPFAASLESLGPLSNASLDQFVKRRSSDAQRAQHPHAHQQLRRSLRKVPGQNHDTDDGTDRAVDPPR
jgi:hypothetical protein